MGWTVEQLNAHPKRDSLLRRVEKPAPAPRVEKPIAVPGKRPRKTFSFVVKCDPMGKPRMTQRDKWQKRPAVLRYRHQCDLIRASAKEHGFDPEWDCYAIRIKAYIAVPPSWSKGKQQRLIGKIVRQTPDWDNIGKAVGDALFKEDAVLGGGSCWKYWCEPGQQRIEVGIKYLARA